MYNFEQQFFTKSHAYSIVGILVFCGKRMNTGEKKSWQKSDIRDDNLFLNRETIHVTGNDICFRDAGKACAHVIPFIIIFVRVQ